MFAGILERFSLKTTNTHLRVPDTSVEFQCRPKDPDGT